MSDRTYAREDLDRDYRDLGVGPGRVIYVTSDLGRLMVFEKPGKAAVLEAHFDALMDLARESAAKHPDVKFRFCEGREGFHRAIWPDGFDDALDLELVFHPAADGDVPFVEIATVQGKIFGPQPFLAIETLSRRFIHDNLDFSPCRRKWFYAFHGDTLPIADVKTVAVAVAANDQFGNTCIRKLHVAAEGEGPS
jgi:hypothetical protein